MSSQNPVSRRGQTASSPWLRPLPPARDPDLALVCFPHAGGSAARYLALLAPLAADTDVAVVQYPGRHDRGAEPPVPSIARLADHIADALDAIRTPRLALFGHSMGALVAFETAIRLQEGSGVTPEHLVVSACRAPASHHAGPAPVLADAALIADLRRLGGTDERILAHPALVRRMLPALRADYAAVAGYRHQTGTTVNAPVTALVGDRDPRVTLLDAHAWSEAAAGPCRVRVVPGGHFYFTERPGLLPATLSAALGLRLRHPAAPVVA